MIQLYIVDDHYLVIEGVRAILAGEEGIRWLGHATTAASCLAFLSQRHRPDVILLDINLPDKSGIDLCQEIKAAHPAVHIIALSTFNQGSYISRMMEAGADGYLLKNASRGEMMDALHTVMHHRRYLSFESAAAVRRHGNAAEAPVVTRREQEVLRFIAEGFTNQEIAVRLFVSVTTVDSHRKHLLDKLGAKNTAALVRIAISHKLIDL